MAERAYVVRFVTWEAFRSGLTEPVWTKSRPFATKAEAEAFMSRLSPARNQPELVRVDP